MRKTRISIVWTGLLLMTQMHIVSGQTPQIRLTNKGQIEQLNTGGSIFIGEDAGNSDDLSSNYNVFIGQLCGSTNTSGNNNEAIGYNAMKSLTTGSFNIAIGSDALRFCQTGANNVSIGSLALYNCQVSNLTACGTYSLSSNTTGMQNSAFGYSSMLSNTIGSRNTSVGYNSLFNNLTGNGNTAVGHLALYSNNYGESNTAIGDSSLFNNANGDSNTAIGLSTLKSNVGGSNNVAIGKFTMYKNVSGNWNVAIGQYALQENTMTSGSTAIGYRSFQNTTGSYNVGVGFLSGFSDINTSQKNVYIGYSAGSMASSPTFKSNNVMIGYSSGSNSQGDGNVFIGYNSGFSESGSNKLYIENSSSSTPLIYGDFDLERVGIGVSSPDDALSVNSTPADNAFRVQVDGATKMRIFNNGSISFGTNNSGISANDVYIHNQLGLGVSAPVYRLELPNTASNSGGRGLANAWNTYSDQRVKTHITPIHSGLRDILQLRPVRYKHHSSVFEDGVLVVNDHEFKNDIGFIAQEVAKLIPEAVSPPEDETSGLWSMAYDKLIPVLVHAMQEQQAMIASQNMEIMLLKEKMQHILQLLEHDGDFTTKSLSAQN